MHLLCSLGILGDYNPEIPTILGLLRGFAMTGYVGRGTSNYPLIVGVGGFNEKKGLRKVVLGICRG